MEILILHETLMSAREIPRKNHKSFKTISVNKQLFLRIATLVHVRPSVQNTTGTERSRRTLSSRHSTCTGHLCSSDHTGDHMRVQQPDKDWRLGQRNEPKQRMDVSDAESVCARECIFVCFIFERAHPYKNRLELNAVGAL